MKQAVPEDEMYAEDADDANFGAHLEAAMYAAMEAEMLESQFGMMNQDDDY